MNSYHCPQCQSRDVMFYEGLLGYEAVRCNTCKQETDLNNPDSHCERTDRVPFVESTLPDLCHHAEYRIYVNGQYVGSLGNIGSNAQRTFESYKRRQRGKFVEVNKLPCRVPNCTWRQS
jgi:hypothetical protein